MKAENQNGIPDGIHHIHSHRNIHGQSGIANGTQHRSTGVKHCQKRIGIGRDNQINQRIFHDIRFDRAKQYRQKRPSCHQCQGHKANGNQHGNHHQLICRTARPVFAFLPDILGYDHAASCRHRGKNIDDHRINHIHKRNAGYGRLACIGDHHGIHHAHSNGQHLFHHQRKNQRAQRLVTEHCILWPVFQSRLHFHRCNLIIRPVVFIYCKNLQSAPAAVPPDPQWSHDPPPR